MTTETRVPLPCTARELEAALHAACDHDGKWDAMIRVRFPCDLVIVTSEPENKGESK